MEIISGNYSQTKLVIKNRYIVSETNSRYDIRTSKNRPVCLQTKKVGFYINPEKGFVLVFFAKEDPLALFFEGIERRVQKFLKKSGYGVPEYTWYSSFNNNQDCNNYTSFFFRIGKNSLIFDHHRKNLEIDRTMRSYGRLLLTIKHIWIVDSSSRKMCGLQTALEQFEIDTDYIFNDYAFIDESETSITFEKHPIYAKYFAMLQKGVPKMAVAQKISMNGDPPEILDYSAKDPIPLSFNSTDSNNLSIKRNNLDIKAINGFDRSRLNSVDLDKLGEKKFIPPKPDNGLAPPSLETILNCLNNLKPVKEDQEMDKNFGYLEQVGII